MKTSPKNLSILGIIVASVIWGTTFYLMKDVVRTVNPLLLVGYRFGFATFVTALIIFSMRKKISAGLKEGAILGGILWCIFMFQTYGIRITTASNSGFITGMYTPFVPILGMILFKKRPRILQWVAIALALIGLWVLAGGIKGTNFGDFLTLCGAFLVAVHILILERYARKNIDPLALAFHQFWIVSLLSFGLAGLLNIPIETFPIRITMQIVYLGLLASVVCFLIQIHAQKHLDAVDVAILFTLEPVFAAIFAWTLGEESFVPARAIGGGLIVSGMLVTEFRIPKRRIATSK